MSNLIFELIGQLWLIALAMKSGLNHATAPLGLSATQGQILFLLAEEPDQGNDSLARKLRVRSSTMSESVRVLVEKGLVGKGHGATDRRSLQLHLTPRGRLAVERMAEWSQGIEQALETLPSDQRAPLLDALTRISGALPAFETKAKGVTP